MKLNRFALGLAGTLFFAVGANAQRLEVLPPGNEPVQIPSESLEPVAPDVLAQAASTVASPAQPNQLQSPEPESAALREQYRTALQSIAAKRHEFVHCKLGNGNVLTGLPRNVGKEGFSLKTDALGETYISYKSLAEMPRPVPAVGTRIKQGAQWTGISALIAVAVPILIVFSPILYFSGWVC
ncbi:MAG: hypothetical protein NVS9B14_04510 [Candidatus Acidiferrum sp.]